MTVPVTDTVNAIDTRAAVFIKLFPMSHIKHTDYWQLYYVTNENDIFIEGRIFHLHPLAREHLRFTLLNDQLQ